MPTINPPIEKIKPNLPVCQYPRESYNRVAEILSHIRSDRGLRISRIGKNGDHWIFSIDQDWLYEFIMAYVNPLIDQTEAAAEYYASAAGHDLSDTVVLYLTGSGATPSQTKWDLGDTNSSGKLYVPVVQQYRLYWNASSHQLLYFSRDMYFTPQGMLYKVSAESNPQAVFTAVPENF